MLDLLLFIYAVVGVLLGVYMFFVHDTRKIQGWEGTNSDLFIWGFLSFCIVFTYPLFYLYYLTVTLRNAIQKKIN